MRLTKTAYHVDYEEIYIGDDYLGRPVYNKVEVLTPFKCEIEPFSEGLAAHQYGLKIDVRFRMFTQPHTFLELAEDIKFDDEIYHIREMMKYDRHYELLIKKGDLYG